MDLIYEQESYKIIGACFEVYNEMGCGFLESVYHECLEMEFEKRSIPFNSREKLKLNYKGITLEKKFEADFVCYNKIIVEVKALEELISQNEAQLLNYLNATNNKLGLLVNFGHHPKLEYKRIVFDKSQKVSPRVKKGRK
ncbi:MAG: GxxExxY protein [Candidatus Marinimicrobia bacterium]|nr:GxxExxY protein [Candidatus Neomarinimicrobiota bacterium]